MFWKSRLQFSRLAVLQAGQAAPASVLVIVPARDEAGNIGRCLDSLRGQEILVVDDGSADDTAGIAERKGARVMKAPALPPGYVGKSNACYAGAQGAAARWLLFLDADTWYEPGFAASLAAHAEDRKLDVVSALLDHRCRTPWEHALVPYWLGLMFAGVDLEAVHSIKLQQLLAFGHCILFRADAYEFTGGHRTVLRRATDDVGVASVVKRHRLRYEVVRAEAWGSVRPGNPWATYQRTIYDFLSYNTASLRWQVVAAMALMACWGPALWWLWRDGERTAMWAFAIAPAVAAMAWYGNPLRALLVPAAVYGLAAAALHSLVTHLFGMSPAWKGRKV